MYFTLKPKVAAFEPVSGPFAGRRFEHGRKYSEVPEEYKNRFKVEQVKQAAAPKKTKQDKEGDK